MLGWLRQVELANFETVVYLRVYFFWLLGLHKSSCSDLSLRLSLLLFRIHSSKHSMHLCLILITHAVHHHLLLLLLLLLLLPRVLLLLKFLCSMHCRVSSNFILWVNFLKFSAGCSWLFIILYNSLGLLLLFTFFWFLNNTSLW